MLLLSTQTVKQNFVRMSDLFSDRVCRICQGDDTDQRPLRHPCKCDGSIKYVHQDCLQQWISSNQRRGRAYVSKCEVCGDVLQWRRLYRPDAPINPLETPVVAAAMRTATTHGFILMTMLAECLADLTAHVATTFLSVMVLTWLLHLKCFGAAWMGRNWMGVLVAGWVWRKCLFFSIAYTGVLSFFDSALKAYRAAWTRHANKREAQALAAQHAPDNTSHALHASHETTTAAAHTLKSDRSEGEDEPPQLVMEVKAATSAQCSPAAAATPAEELNDPSSETERGPQGQERTDDEQPLQPDMEPIPADPAPEPAPAPAPAPARAPDRGPAPAAEPEPEHELEHETFPPLVVQPIGNTVLVFLPALLGAAAVPLAEALSVSFRGVTVSIVHLAQSLAAQLEVRHWLVAWLGQPRELLAEGGGGAAEAVVGSLMRAGLQLAVGHLTMWPLLCCCGLWWYARYVGTGAGAWNTWTDMVGILSADLPQVAQATAGSCMQLLVNFALIPLSMAALITALLLPHIRPALGTTGAVAVFVGAVAYVHRLFYEAAVVSAARAMIIRPEYQRQLVRTVDIADGPVQTLDVVARNCVIYATVGLQLLLAVVVIPLLLGPYLCPLPLPPLPAVTPDLASLTYRVELNMVPSVVLPEGWALRAWDPSYLTALRAVLSVTGPVLYSVALDRFVFRSLLHLAGVGFVATDLEAGERGRLFPPDTPQAPLPPDVEWRYDAVGWAQLLVLVPLSAWAHRVPLVVGRWAVYWLARLFPSAEGYATSVSDLFVYPLGLILGWTASTSARNVLRARPAPPLAGSEGVTLWFVRWAAAIGAACLRQAVHTALFVAWTVAAGLLTGLMLCQATSALAWAATEEISVLHPVQLVLTGHAAMMWSMKWLLRNPRLLWNLPVEVAAFALAIVLGELRIDAWTRLRARVAASLLDCAMLPVAATHLLDLYLATHSTTDTALHQYAARVGRGRWGIVVFVLGREAAALLVKVPGLLQATLRDLREDRYLVSKTLLDREE